MKTVLPNQFSPTGIADCDTEFLNRHSTRVMIQETATRRYLTGNDTWTIRPVNAMTFTSGSAAMEYLTQRKLENVRLVLTRDITVSEIISVQQFN